MISVKNLKKTGKLELDGYFTFGKIRSEMITFSQVSRMPVSHGLPTSA
jgi:hypothetical protein